jgi:hypothetical protein
MDESGMQDFLTDALHFYNEDLDPQVISRVETFERAMLLTRDKGLIITLKDGSQFQITVVQSKFAQCEEEQQGSATLPNKKMDCTTEELGEGENVE